jgi:hypothetical protein
MCGFKECNYWQNNVYCTVLLLTEEILKGGGRISLQLKAAVAILYTQKQKRRTTVKIMVEIGLDEVGFLLHSAIYISLLLLDSAQPCAMGPQR